MPGERVYSSKCTDFINDEAIEKLASMPPQPASRVREIIAKSLNKEALKPEETAILLSAESPELVEEIFEAARELKRKVYGNRIVLFAPLYVGNFCVNDCSYCAFRRSLRTTVRKTLSDNELESEVRNLETLGHKRLILVFGEHPDYSPEFIASTVKQVYSIKEGKGSIRRVNINAAPQTIEGYKTIKGSGIGTYQIFQETYHHETYKKVHPAGHKSEYLWRLDGLSRAYEGGCDDVGIGALFGLYNWKFEVLGLVTHAIHLQNLYGVGPHTISFPRLQPAHGVEQDRTHFVSDYDFKRLVAILRLSVPYTGMILTARESAEIRRELMSFGVSQIDAGTKLEIGGYSEKNKDQELKREQFKIGDSRSLEEILNELVKNDYIPSFCTSCYRLGRTGQQFMEFAIPGFIERFCTPNALLTLEEYLLDYAGADTLKEGEALIEREMAKIPDENMRAKLKERLEKMKKESARDLYF